MMAQVRPKRTAALPVRAGPARCSRLDAFETFCSRYVAFESYEPSEFLRVDADGPTNAHNREIPRPNQAAQRGQVQVQGIGRLRHGEQLKNRRILLVLSHLSPPKVALALAKTGNKAVSRHGPRFCNRCRNDREVARLPLVTAAPAGVTILTKAEGGTQWEKRAARMSRSLSRTRSRKGRAGRLLLESL
jgi:hypothetical protein